MSRTPEDILDDMNECGIMPTPQEVSDLVELVDEGEYAKAALQGLMDAMEEAGWATIDITTDDDEDIVMQLVPPE